LNLHVGRGKNCAVFFISAGVRRGKQKREGKESLSLRSLFTWGALSALGKEVEKDSWLLKPTWEERAILSVHRTGGGCG